jgi:hypothetical protein
MADPARAAPISRDNRPLAQLFGFAQFDLAGTLPIVDGRYVVRDGRGERVLVLETLGAPPPPRRRRRRPRRAEADASPEQLPLTRATVVRAHAPFGEIDEARRWLERSTASEEAIDGALAEGIEVLNRALHVQAVASEDPHVQALNPSQTVGARLGYGSGEEVAAGGFTSAQNVDVRAHGAPGRRQRDEQLRPQERLAAVLGGREQLDACETLLLRARADLDAGRTREAALQLRVGLEALLTELRGVLSDPGHEEDMATLESRRQEAGDLANVALREPVEGERAEQTRDLLEICERVLRRRRVLRG